MVNHQRVNLLGFLKQIFMISDLNLLLDGNAVGGFLLTSREIYLDIKYLLWGSPRNFYKNQIHDDFL
jgi:hypothetical protein